MIIAGIVEQTIALKLVQGLLFRFYKQILLPTKNRVSRMERRKKILSLCVYYDVELLPLFSGCIVVGWASDKIHFFYTLAIVVEYGSRVIFVWYGNGTARF